MHPEQPLLWRLWAILATRRIRAREPVLNEGHRCMSPEKVGRMGKSLPLKGVISSSFLRTSQASHFLRLEGRDAASPENRHSAWSKPSEFFGASSFSQVGNLLLTIECFPRCHDMPGTLRASVMHNSPTSPSSEAFKSTRHALNAE